MPFKKSLIASLLLVFCGLAGLAQGPKIVYSEPEREDSRRTSFEVIGKLSGNFLVYKSNRSDDAICIYDNDMKLKEKERDETDFVNVDDVDVEEQQRILSEIDTKLCDEQYLMWLAEKERIKEMEWRKQQEETRKAQTHQTIIHSHNMVESRPANTTKTQQETQQSHSKQQDIR